MKRFWIVLLSLGLLAAFSVSAYAVDVKFSGDFYAGGMYLDKTNVRKEVGSNAATAFYFQRLRVRTDFVVSPGLSLVTRFDALERVWGAARSNPSSAMAVDSPGTVAEAENIAFEWAYISYNTPIGLFNVGMMSDGGGGTIFANSAYTSARIQYTYTNGGLNIQPCLTKMNDLSYTAKNTAVNYTDADYDKFGVHTWYEWKGGKAGLMATYYHDARNRIVDNTQSIIYELAPYVMHQFGPVYVEAEGAYAWGKDRAYDDPNAAERKVERIRAYVNAVVTLGPIYFGATGAYLSGDDPNTAGTNEGGYNGGRDWNPTLVMFNYFDRAYWAGSIAGYGPSADAGTITNAWFGQGKFGVRPTPALDIYATVSYAQADKKPTGYLNSTYGWEVDVVGTYKITSNLSYMLGVGYWFVGDYYKYDNNANDLRDDFTVINKLTLTF